MYDKVFICILRKYTSKNKIFVHNLAGLSRSVPDAAGLVRQLNGLGIELYAPDRSMVEVAEEIMKAVSNIST